jgi:hypothetical protein
MHGCTDRQTGTEYCNVQQIDEWIKIFKLLVSNLLTLTAPDED